MYLKNNKGMLYTIDIGVFFYFFGAYFNIQCSFNCFFLGGSLNYRKDDITLLVANINDASAAEGILP